MLNTAPHPPLVITRPCLSILHIPLCGLSPTICRKTKPILYHTCVLLTTLACALSLSRTLGTPNNDIWPEVESLPDYKDTFPKWNAVNLASMVKNLDKNGLDLLGVSNHGDHRVRTFFGSPLLGRFSD